MIYNQLMDVTKILSECAGFQWDRGNLDKSWFKHRVSPFEAEQIFFNQPLVAAEDTAHSQNEIRYYALGKTDGHRLLFLVFTVRGHLIRIISARAMNRKERKEYQAYE